MLSCILCALGSFATEAQNEVQRLLGCQIELSKNEWYGVVYIDVYIDIFESIVNYALLIVLQ